jgi:hypothetical protein
MSYSKFTIEEIYEKFGIVQVLENKLFADVKPRKISQWLVEHFDRFSTLALMQGTEKAKSEMIIAPIFADLRYQSEETLSVFSGSEFNVNKKLGLSGFCDFLISRSPTQNIIQTPVVITVEAKRWNFEKGYAQCISEMIAARIFNEKKGNPQKQIYGCVTTGNIWQFLVLRENEVLTDTTTYDFLQDLERIFGILWSMSFGEIDIK